MSHQPLIYLLWGMSIQSDPAFLLLGISSEEMKTCLHKDLHMNIHSSIIHKGQNG